MSKFPIIQAPVSEVQLETIKDPVKFRPFTVKEERILLSALQGVQSVEKLTPKQKKTMTDAMAQICHNCTFGEIDVYGLPVVDLNMLFNKLKEHSAGNVQRISMPCSNDKCVEEKDGVTRPKETILALNYENFEYVRTEGHSTRIDLVDDISVIMKYPSFKQAAAFDGKEKDPDTIYALTLECIDMIIVGDEAMPVSQHSLGELQEFLDSLTTPLRMKITSFFDTMPKVLYHIDYKCPHCGHQNEFHVESIEDFFV